MKKAKKKRMLISLLIGFSRHFIVTLFNLFSIYGQTITSAINRMNNHRIEYFIDKSNLLVTIYVPKTKKV